MGLHYRPGHHSSPILGAVLARAAREFRGEEEEDSQITVIIPRFIVSPPFSPRRFRHKSLAGFAEGENTWISLVNYFSSCVKLQLFIQMSKASIVEFSFKVSFATTMPTHHSITSTKSGGGST